MTANELRTGNWITVDEPANVFLGDTRLNGFCRLNSYGIYLIDVGAAETTVKPILLTPEILEKANNVGGSKGDLIADMISSNEIQYVHQLQNLYFALTGEELDINL